MNNKINITDSAAIFAHQIFYQVKKLETEPKTKSLNYKMKYFFKHNIQFLFKLNWGSALNSE